MNRKKRAQHFILGLLLVITCASACKPDNKVHVTYMNKDLKNYFNYKVGSYWVFMDSLNNSTDSLSVTEISEPLLYPNGNAVDESKRFYFYMFGVFPVVDTIEYVFELDAIYSSVLFVNYSTSGMGVEYPYNFTNNMPFDTGKINLANGNFIGFYRNTFFNAVQIRGNTYNDVYKIEFYNSVDKSSDVFFINKDVGFIAILLSNNYRHKSLYLKKYNVLR